MNIEWNAKKYTSDFSYVHKYGEELTGLISAAEGSTVLDLGCGNGALTAVLGKKFLSFGMDSSEELLSIARARYPDIKFFSGDATCFSLQKPVDVVFSNAVFHWIDAPLHPQMLKCVKAALKEGGEFVFEFGGKGNNRLIHAALKKAFAAFGYDYETPFYFPSVGEYAALLEEAGFEVRFAALFDRPTPLKGKNGMADFIDMFVKKPFSVVKSEEERRAIRDTAQSGLFESLYRDGKWFADYVRLRMKAVKPRVNS